MARHLITLLSLCLGLSTLTTRAADEPAGELVYISAFAGADDGIYSARLDEKTGHLSSVNQAIRLDRTGWLIKHPTLPVIYSVAATSGGRAVDAHIYSFAIDPATGRLTMLNDVDAGGREATHLAIDAPSLTLFSANHDSGSVSALPLSANGSLSPVASVQTDPAGDPIPGRQQRVVAHCVAIDPSHRYVLVADLGADHIFIYHFDAATRALALAGSATLPPGSGPRHLVFHPSGKFVYLVTETTAQMVVLGWDAKQGQLHSLQSFSTFPAGHSDKDVAAAEVGTSHDGRFVYASIRGDQDSIVVYAVDPRSGMLTEIQRIPSGGKSPRSFAIDPLGRWLLVANDASGSVTVLKVDTATGKLSSTGQSVSLPKAASIVFYVRAS